MRIFTGKCNISQSGSGSGFWQVTITSFNDPGGLDTTEIAVGDFLIFTDSGTTFQLVITEVVSAVGTSAIVKVSNVGVTGISSVPTTSGAAISRGSTNYNLTPFIANISSNDNQLISEYNTASLDEVMADFTSTSDVVSIINEGALNTHVGGTVRTAASTNNWTSVTYGNGVFVATATNGTGNGVMTSYDGINWISRTTPGSNSWGDVTYGNGVFIAVSPSATDRILRSTDNGTTWLAINVPLLAYRDIAYGNGVFVAVAASFTSGYNAIYSTDNGLTWTGTTIGVSGGAGDNQWRGVTWGNGLFVTVAYTGTGDRVATSADGINWTVGTSAADNDWVAVTYGKGKFVAISATGTSRIMYSTDGLTWNTASSANDTYTWRGITYGNGMFVAINGSSTYIGVSLDGVNWESSSGVTGGSAYGNSPQDIAYGNGVFVTVGTTGAGGSANRVVTSGYPLTSIPVEPYKSYRSYVALLNQSGTNAPTATVLENTLGTTVSYSYIGAGSYSANVSGSDFIEDKTTAQISTTTGYVSSAVWETADQIGIVTLDASSVTPTNDGLFKTMFEIRIYS